MCILIEIWAENQETFLGFLLVQTLEGDFTKKKNLVTLWFIDESLSNRVDINK